MHPLLKNDLIKTSELLELAKQQAVEYLCNLNQKPTCATKKENDRIDISASGVGAIETLQLFNDHYQNLIVASSGPRYSGFVIGGTTPASIVGDWLATVYDQNPFATTGNGDKSAQIELETIQLLLQLFDLPASFLGGFVTGATMSNFTCLAVARQWAGKNLGADIAKDGMQKGIKILSATPHSSAIKSLSMLGFGSNNYIKIKVAEGNREAIDIYDLETKLEQFSNDSCILISSAGTVNTVDFDDLNSIAMLKAKYNFWWHIDAAFGAFAACSPEYKHLLSGWEDADSITVDCHKWLNVPYDSAVFFVQEKHKILQVETFQNSNAPYLGDPLADFTYINFLPENSRRLRALPSWFSLVAYGREGYRDIVENNIRLAKHLGEKIEQSEEFELLAPVRLNTVCFTLSGNSSNSEAINSFISTLNKRGKVFMTPTFFNGCYGIRAALVNWRTTEQDIEIIWEELIRSIKASEADATMG